MTAVARNNFELRRVDRPVDFEATGFDLDDSSSRTAGDIAWSRAQIGVVADRAKGPPIRWTAPGPLASAAFGGLWQMRGRDGGETNSTEYQPIARRPASQSSALRLKLPGVEAVLSISIESNEADLVRGSPTMIDLTESELGDEHLAVIMRWLTERLQVHSDALRPLAPTGLTKWRLKRVLTYIDEHICELITLATLAQVAGLSRMYFASQFRAATGCGPHECILRKRIERAQQLLLETSEPLVSIALTVGFQSQAHFSTVFKRFAGLTPNQWRAANCDVRSLGGATFGEGQDQGVAFVLDLSKPKRAEENLRESERRCCEAQAERAHVDRVMTMGRLTASIAHEINQPLAGIASNGVAGLNWLNCKKPDLDQARDAFSRIVRDSARANDVICGLRALVKKSGPQLAKLDIDDVIREVLALTTGELRRHGVALHTDLAAGDRPVLGDRVQLQQVVLNLIMNGVEAMSGVTERTRELMVSTSLAEPGSVLVSVEDTGMGLDPAVAQRLFEPFFTTKSEGLGMGLSICRSIVEVHRGRLWASPRVPHGAAIRFTVPAELAQ